MEFRRIIQSMNIDLLEQEWDTVNSFGIVLYINIKSLLYNSQNLLMTYSVIYPCDWFLAGKFDSLGWITIMSHPYWIGFNKDGFWPNIWSIQALRIGIKTRLLHYYAKKQNSSGAWITYAKLSPNFSFSFYNFHHSIKSTSIQESS